MSLVFKSLVGTLAVASTLAGTVGTTLYVWRCVDFAIHDAVAHQLAELQSEEGMGHVSIDRGEADSETWSVFEAMNQPPEGALMDSRGVAVLIDELGEAGPQEREVWTQLLRRPDSDESYRSLFSYYRGMAPQNVRRTIEQPTSVIRQASMPPSPSLPGDGGPRAANSAAALESSIEALRIARQLLIEKAMNQELSVSCERHERLFESRPQPQQLREEPVESNAAPAQSPD